MNIIHMDIKDENVLLKNVGGDPRNIEVKLIDFGLAIQTSSKGKYIEVDKGTGQHCYRSPEQILTGFVSPASDLWSLGCLIAEMVTGEYFLENYYDQPMDNFFKGGNGFMKHVRKCLIISYGII